MRGQFDLLRVVRLRDRIGVQRAVRVAEAELQRERFAFRLIQKFAELRYRADVDRFPLIEFARNCSLCPLRNKEICKQPGWRGSNQSSPKFKRGADEDDRIA
jgi:hypothetical protein